MELQESDSGIGDDLEQDGDMEEYPDGLLTGWQID
jgi:hypothetical protein